VQLPEAEDNVVDFSRNSPHSHLQLETDAAHGRPSTRSVTFPKNSLEASIPERFEEQVLVHPHRLAAKTRSREWTYSELNSFANRLAHALLLQGAQPEHRIALLLEHDALPIASFLAVLKAAGICVPLEPHLPEARIRYILEDAEAEWLVTNRRNLPLARRLIDSGRRILNVDDLPGRLPEGNPALPIRPKAPAYIIYTSGSTGMPKGVLQNHRNILHDVWGYTHGFSIDCSDRLCQLASCSVGQGIKVCFNALLNGAALLPFNVREEGTSKLALWLNEQRITIYLSAATVFRHLVGVLTGAERFPSVRLLRLASEPIRRSDYEQFQRYFSAECIFANGLASSETGNFTQYLVRGMEDIPGTLVPVGYPVEDKEVLLLDDDGHDVGDGNVGEIAVKSAFLSPGYWRRPDLNGRAFLRVAEDPEIMIYRTGDLGFRYADGCIEHRGRQGFRIKIRGYRVELDEVETVLKKHPSVRDAVVKASESKSGEMRLIAYIVPEREPPRVAQLRDHLRGSLPDPMLPAAFVMLDAIPLALSGKPDRQALPVPETLSNASEDNFLAPRDTVEEQLVAIWAGILNVNRVGVLDNFFELGGHSLTATQVTSRVRGLFHVEMPLREFLERPTIAEIAQFIARQRSQGAECFGPTIRPVSRDRELPLSFAQQRLWFLNQLIPEDPVYNMSRVVRIQGSLNLSALEKSLTEIVRRHEPLRTLFPAHDGRPYQKILYPRAILLETVDLSGLSRAEAEGEARIRIECEVRRPYDLRQDLPFRTLFLRVGRDEHLLVMTLHHIVSDRWSRWILTRELTALYQAFSEGKASPLPDPPIQYADFAFWQREWLTGDVLSQQMSYWKSQLSGIPVLELPADRARPAIQSSHGATLSFTINSPVSEALRRLGQNEGTTPYITFLAAFQCLLHRYTGQEDFGVGTPIANRNRIEIEGLIGFFVNTLVLRANMTGNPTFREILRRTREAALGAFAHQDLPFEKIVEELNPERHTNRTPLFQVMFALQNVPSSELQLSGQQISTVEIDHGTAMFDLTLSIFEAPGNYRGVIEFNTDIFDRDRITRMQGHLCTMLDAIAADPDLRLGALPLLTESERRQIVEEWSGPRVTHAAEPCVHQLFAAQAERTPRAVALMSPEGDISYAELDRRANQLAHYLQSLGVGPEVRVGIHQANSLDLVVSILATLKAGGAYVPLDPDYPPSRLEFMAVDAGIAVLLTKTALLDSIPRTTALVSCLDSERDLICRQPGDCPDAVLSPDNLAYVIYTSGSTGKPKGVMVSHRAISNHTLWIRSAFSWNEADRFVFHTPISFDTFACDLYPPLSVGARVVLFPPELRRDLTALSRHIEEYEITSIQVVPSMLPLLLGQQDFGKKRALRLVLCGGEPLAREQAARFHARLDARLFNLYGPTETAIDATCYHVQAGEPPSNVPIGKPISNAKVYILDRYLNPVPVGVPGEIFIGGVCLSRGYLGRPDLTAEMFIPSPFSDTPGERLYKTGDLARHQSHGEIEFLGRLDDQIKLRGLRIELGEIESCLAQHPAVETAAVICREDAPGEKRLAAYIVPRRAEKPEARDLREFLSRTLPEYMVPGDFVTMAGFPRLPSGKIDRKTLPPPDVNRSWDTGRYVAPRTKDEERVAKVWAQVLGLEQVGVFDDFFELGGHSLLATQVISRLREEFRTDLPLHFLFDNPTVAGLLIRIIKQRSTDTRPG
jgi:amino acid adenylation domain-containing protein